ncbi:MAG: copper-binding protein [Proteobacteria bacterium]|nr:copper-binding protein [Pseudomonadota bacterium]
MEHDEVNHQQNSSSCADDSSCSMAHGVVLSLSKEVSKITLRHGEIPNIDMPPMTMVFTVEDSSLMQNLKEGDHVLFHVENIGGEYIIKDMIEDHH